MSKRSNLTKPARRTTSFVVMLGLTGLIFSLGCSIGALVVQVGTPTPPPHKTLQATFTITPIKTATFTPSPTSTATSTPTPTSTPAPSPTSPPQDTTAPPPDQAQEAAAPAAPVEPTATPAPAEPMATPTSAFPFNVVFFLHDTGSPGETRITGWIRQDSGPGMYKTLSNFQIKAIAPDGNVYLSDPSGSGTADSTTAGTGDNHRMNTKLEIRPYTSGVYKIQLVEGDVPVSAEVEITLAAEPRQYVHFEFFKSK